MTKKQLTGPMSAKKVAAKVLTALNKVPAKRAARVVIPGAALKKERMNEDADRPYMTITRFSRMLKFKLDKYGVKGVQCSSNATRLSREAVELLFTRAVIKAVAASKASVTRTGRTDTDSITVRAADFS